MNGRTLKTNIVINVFGAVIPLAVALITVPIYIRHIGNARYGVLSIVWVLLGYFGFLDLGLSRAAANALARLRHAPAAGAGARPGHYTVSKPGLGLCGSLCLAVFGSYFLQYLAVPDALKPEIAGAFPWIVGLFPLALISGVAIGTLDSREHFLLANVLQASGTSMGQIVPVILAITIEPSLTIVIPTAAIARGLTVLAALIAVYRFEGPLSFSNFDRNQARKLLSYGGWVSVSGVVGPILTSFDQFVIGAVLNVAAVAHYAVPMNVVARSQIFAASLARTLFPRMSSVGPDEARELATRALVSLAYTYAALCSPAIIMTPIFFRYWINMDFAVIAAPVADILFFGAWINGLAFVPSALLHSQGRPDVNAKFHAAEVLPFIGILWGLTSAFGIMGAALAWSLRCGTDAALLFWASGMPRRVLLQAVGAPLCLLMVSQMVVLYIRHSLWISFAAAAVAGVAGTTLALIVSKDLRSWASALAFRATTALNPSQSSPNVKPDTLP